MKEKLYKTNHKRGYYRVRQFLMVSFLVLSAAVAVSVPTYIGLLNKEAISSNAEEVQSETLDTFQDSTENI